MFQIKSLALAAAAACVAVPAMADLKNVDIYGVVALGMMSTVNGAGQRNTEVLNESRIGFRGAKPLALPKLGTDVSFIWQLETGFLGPNGLTAQPYESGNLGTRDTFAGLQGGFGKIRIGRLLTPFGETLDWPFANGGVNPLVEATSVPGGGSYVRVSDQLRWDSPKWDGLTVGVSYGRGD
ncbi:MAG: outer rane porin protein, partial [Rhodoferax sp.]|nr:outer rane porin protein [Rhodoferax sp.]